MNISAKETSGGVFFFFFFNFAFPPTQMCADSGYGGTFADDRIHYLWFGDQVSAVGDVAGVRHQLDGN